MKVEFIFYNRETRAPHIPVSFTRDVKVLPRVGDHIVRHQDQKTGTSPVFEVKHVTHVFEDRAEYVGKSYGGDRLVVTMQLIPEEEATAMHNSLIEAGQKSV